jgi:hypothetical protein
LREERKRLGLPRSRESGASRAAGRVARSASHWPRSRSVRLRASASSRCSRVGVLCSGAGIVGRRASSKQAYSESTRSSLRIVYSRSPAASRASARLRNCSSRSGRRGRLGLHRVRGRVVPGRQAPGRRRLGQRGYVQPPRPGRGGISRGCGRGGSHRADAARAPWFSRRGTRTSGGCRFDT